MGLLVGIIVGISVSPTVKIVLSALAALLAAFLGVQDSKKAKDGEDADYSKSILSGLRAGSFGLTCVVGIMLGIFLRTNGVLGESIQDQIAEWEKAGFKPDKARDLVVYKNLAIKPKDWVIAEMSEVQRQALATSFSDESEGVCDNIKLSTNKNDIEYTLLAYESSGDNLKQLAEIIRSIDDTDKQRKLLLSIEEVICNLEVKK